MKNLLFGLSLILMVQPAIAVIPTVKKLDVPTSTAGDSSLAGILVFASACAAAIFIGYLTSGDDEKAEDLTIDEYADAVEAGPAQWGDQITLHALADVHKARFIVRSTEHDGVTIIEPTNGVGTELRDLGEDRILYRIELLHTGDHYKLIVGKDKLDAMETVGDCQFDSVRKGLALQGYNEGRAPSAAETRRAAANYIRTNETLRNMYEASGGSRSFGD